MASFRSVLSGIAAVVFAGSLAACAPSPTSVDDGSGGGHASSGSKQSGAGQGGDGATTGTGFTDGAGDTGSTGSNMGCASSTIQAELSPLAMYIMFDKSGSMGDNNKWTNASNALKAFFGDPGAKGLEVALRFFPDGACDGSQCDVNACATPKVDAGALTADPAPMDTQEQSLVNAVNQTSPNGNTPMYAALKGGEQWGTSYLTAHPDHKVVVVLVTDGEPNGCIEDVNQIADQAAQGYAAGVMTFAIGMQGANQSTLDQISNAGGSGPAFIIGNGNAEADLLAALEAIRGKAIACELDIPTPQNGTIDPTKVNVSFTPTNGADETIGHVNDAGSCGTGGGWYYDDPAHPTKIILCPNTCDTVQGDDGAKLGIVLGCDTVPA